MFARADKLFGAPPDVVVYNPSSRVRGSIVDIDPAAVEKALAITAYGGFLVAQQAAKRMVPRGNGAILFTGASASVKGYPLSASFAMGKFALRGLAQSIARELAPKGVHVAHFVIDGGNSQRAPHRAGGRARLHAGPRCDCAQLSQRARAGPQRVDVGDRIAAVGREILTACNS